MTSQMPVYQYIDGIGRIRFENGVIKIELVVMREERIGTSTKIQQVPTTETTLVLSKEGFSQAHDTMQKMAKSLEADKKTAKPETTKHAKVTT